MIPPFLLFGIEGPWYVQLGIVAGAITAVRLIWTQLVRSVVTTLWEAVKAAPELRDAGKELVAILKGDVLHRMDALVRGMEHEQKHNAAQDGRLDAHDDVLTQHEERLLAHDRSLAELAERVRNAEEQGAQ